MLGKYYKNGKFNAYLKMDRNQPKIIAQLNLKWSLQFWHNLLTDEKNSLKGRITHLSAVFVRIEIIMQN